MAALLSSKIPPKLATSSSSLSLVKISLQPSYKHMHCIHIWHTYAHTIRLNSRSFVLVAFNCCRAVHYSYAKINAKFRSWTHQNAGFEHTAQIILIRKHLHICTYVCIHYTTKVSAIVKPYSGFMPLCVYCLALWDVSTALQRTDWFSKNWKLLRI